MLHNATLDSGALRAGASLHFVNFTLGIAVCQAFSGILEAIRIVRAAAEHT